MDISSLSQYASLYTPTFNFSTSSNQGSSQTDSDDSENFNTIFGTTLSNSDGDTAQLSSSGIEGMPPPPMMGNDTTASDISSFMDEVANGTATDTDLQNLETELEQAQAASSTSSSTGTSTSSSTGTSTSSSTGTSTSSSTSASNIRADIKSFMDEVANGTATDTDLQNLETELEQAQAASSTSSSTGTSTSSSTGTSTSSSTSTSNIRADIKSFMDEVANGTATDTDLQNMETELEQAQASSSISQQMLDSAISAYSNNNTGYLWNSTQSTTA